VIDPTTRRVTHLVLEPNRRATLLGSRLAPVELVDPNTAGSEIALRCTIEQAGELPPVEEVTYLRLGAFPVEDPDWDVGVSDVLAAPYYGAGELGAPIYPTDVGLTYDRIPKNEVEIRRASIVTSKDGEDLGEVEAFIVDDEDKVTHFVLERGHLWGRRDVSIPIGAVTKIETDSVTLALTKDQVGALPAVRVHRW